MEKRHFRRRSIAMGILTVTMAVGAYAAGNINGAIYTTTGDGTAVDANIYASKPAVYLNGGPQNQKDPGLVPDGNYYFQVTDPSGAVLLSADDITCRVVVVSGGRIVGVPSDNASGMGNPACYHAVGAPNPANGGLPVQLMPFNDTPNPGGEYKAWLTQVGNYGTSCASGNGSHASSGFCDSYSKTDNFKVRLANLAYVTVCKFNDVNGDGVQDAGEPTIPHWPITATGVEGGTLNTQTNDDGCVTLTAAGGSAVTVSEGTFGPDWHQTAPADGAYGPFTVSGGVIAVTPNAGDKLSAPSFGNTNPACGSPCDMTNLVVTKTAFPALTRTFTWNISKSVDRTQVKQSGASAQFNYAVDVTHDAGVDSNWRVTGAIRVSNPGPTSIGPIDVLDHVDNGGTCDVVAGQGVTIDAGSHKDFTYACTYSSLPARGVNTASTSFSAATGTATVDFAAAAIDQVDSAVTVSDTLAGTLGTVSVADPSPAEFDYAHTVTGTPGSCVDQDNVATFTTNATGTTGSASKSVRLCVGADLQVTKTAAASYSSTISKSVDRTLVEQAGGTATFNYQVGVTESGWTVQGAITATNPNDWESVTATVTDTLGNCTLAGGGAITVGPGSSATVPYSCRFTSAPPAANGLNTALVTWDAAAFFTPSPSASATAPYAFAPLTVSDTFNGTPTAFGPIAGNVASSTFAYGHTVVNGVGGTCTAYANTAVINETGARASQTATICNTATGDTTMGFWTNKNGQGIIAGANQIALAAYLRQYPPFANLTTPIATYVSGVMKSANASGASMNPMLKAQMLATALGVYFSDPALGGNRINAAIPLGGVKIALTTVCATVSSSSCLNNVTEVASAAFANATSMTVAQLLASAGSQSNAGGSTWYGNVKSIQELAKDTFDAINNQVANIAP